MKILINSISLLFGLTIIISSCGNSSENSPNSENENEDQSSVQDTLTNVEEDNDIPEEEMIWAVYEGELGLYGSHYVMELGIQGTKVTGSYFYSKHQKPLQLSGEMDPVTNKIFLEEKYKGKSTGFMEFTLIKGELEGFWVKSLHADDKEEFTGRILNISANSRKEYHPVHSLFEDTHEISFYDGEEDQYEEVTDELTFNKLDDQYFSFYYHVTGTNAHLGSIEGVAKMTGKNKAVFHGLEGCKLEFEFAKNEKTDVINITEFDCTTYHGYHAHFDGSLSKVK